MIGESAGQRVGRLSDVKPQRGFGFTRLPPCDNVVARPNLLRAEAERVAVEHQRNACIGKARQGNRRTAKRMQCAGARGIVVDWLVTIPFRLRQCAPKAVDLIKQRRRGDAPRQQRQPCALT